MGSSFPLRPHGGGRLNTYPSVREATPQPENQLLLTKGDNNYLDDVELYQGLDWLEHKHIIGKVRGCVIAPLMRYSPLLSPEQILALRRICDDRPGT